MWGVDGLTLENFKGIAAHPDQYESIHAVQESS